MHNIKPAAQQVGDVSVAAVGFGLRGVSYKHHGLRDEVAGTKDIDAERMETFLHYCDWATAAYDERTVKDKSIALVIPVSGAAGKRGCSKGFCFGTQLAVLIKQWFA